MNKRLLLITSALAIVMIGSIIFVAASPSDDLARQAQSASDDDRPQGTAISEPPRPAPPAGSDTAPGAGSYTDYSEAALASATGTRLLFFHADWCPQCRALEADIKAEGVPAGVTIFKVDYDRSQALRQKYGVTIQTTIVKIDAQGNLVQKYVAYDQPTMAKVEENLL